VSVQETVNTRRPAVRRALALFVFSLLMLTGCTPGHPTRLETPARPAGWKTVTYHGIGIDVPRQWTVQRWVPNCGADTPTVYIGPEGVSDLNCPAFSTGAAEVVLGALHRTLGPSRSATLNGISTTVSTMQQQEVFHGTCGCSVVITSLEVAVPSYRLSIYVHAGDNPSLPGGGPGRADQIVHTIHAVTRTVHP